MSWKQRQQAWNAPARKSTQVNEEQQCAARARESERNESFEQVFLEVFGRQEHERAREKFGSEQYEPGALDDTPGNARAGNNAAATATSATDVGARDDTPSSQSSSAGVRSSTLSAAASSNNNSSQSSGWGFKSSSAVISVDDFEAPPESASGLTPGAGASGEFARWKEANASRAVSDNFVKLHMRKRVKGSTGKAKKRPAYLRARYDPSEDGSGGANDAFMDPLSVRDRAAASGSVQSSSTSSGFVNDGLDFIEDCLEALARVESQRASASQSDEMRSSSQALAIVDAASGPDDAARDEEEEEVLPPRCHHALVCSKVAVKKKNKNHGRVFFSCPLGFEEGRCDFFLWEDNHTQLALRTLFASAAAAAQENDIPEYVPLDLARPMHEQEDALVTNLRLVFGHASFRAGQQWAITRVFERKHTLLVLPTGAGKSLCYQYPAMFLPGVTLVISPLISLMNDQFENLPPVLKAHAACLASSSAGSKAQYAEFVRDLLGGRLKLVFLSPERAVSNGFQQLLVQIRSRVSLVCVDEAHCISEWSHHFRPSYLRLQTLFQHAQCVLAITATASTRVIDDILAQFGGDAEMVLQMPWQRSNLELQVRRVRSNDERIESLVRFLSSTKVAGGIIMYVHQQRQAEDMAAVLKEQLPGAAWQRKIAYYHARMDAEAKEKVRTGFLSGRLRVVIATIAFGMGIDKQNVRCVIHFHMPSSVENYLQQVGRAGRDGKRATGLLYLLPDDVQTFRSLSFSNAFHVDQLRKLLTRMLFAGDSTGVEDGDDNAHLQHIVAVRSAAVDGSSNALVHVSLEMEWLEMHLDMKAATIETFLTLMAIKNDRKDGEHAKADTPLSVQLQPSSMSVCVLYVIEKKLREAPDDSVLKRIVCALSATSQRHGRIEKETNGYLIMLVVEFHVREMAEVLFGGDSTQLLPLPAGTSTGSVCERRLLQHVRKMQQDGEIQRFTLERNAFQLDLEWRKQHVAPDEKRALVDAWTEQLYAKHLQLEAMEVGRLTRLYGALHAASLASTRSTGAENEEEGEARLEKAQELEDKLVQYFEQESVAPQDDALMKALLQPLTPSVIAAIEHDVRALVHLPVCEAPGEGDEEDEAWGDFAVGTRSGLSRKSASKSKNNISSKKKVTVEMQREMAKTRWTCYSVAKVFHGLASPCFPLLRWRDHSCWKKYDAFAFEQLVTIAAKVLREEAEA